MATTLKLRRGTTTQHATFTGEEGEVTVDTTKDTVVVHDGSTAGGVPMARESVLSNYAPLAGATFTNDISVSKSGSNSVIGAERTSASTAGKIELISGNDTNALLSYGSKELIVGTNGAEKYRVGASGQLGVGGANYGTSGQVLTSQGSGAAPAWSDSASFPSGTRMTFNQTSAPTGWTKDTTAGLNDSIMRIVTGTVGSGGSNAFSTFNGQTTVGSTTLSTSDIPSHTHTIPGSASGGSPGYQTNTARLNVQTSATGGGGSHNHSITTNIKYNDFIIASKD